MNYFIADTAFLLRDTWQRKLTWRDLSFDWVECNGRHGAWHYHGAKSSPGESNGTTLQYSCMENTMDGEAWWAAVHGVTEGQTRLSDFSFTFHFHALEKEMATHSSVLAWRIPGTEEPGGLPSMGLHRVGHDWSDLAAAAAAKFESIKSYLYTVTGEGNEHSVFLRPFQI